MSTDEVRKLAAIMFTDMVGYSALSQRDDKLALELLEEHRELLREIFPRFNGTEIKTIGDAFLIEFNSALEAAQCAIEIQRALAKRNHDVSPARQIELKIGIHIGDVVHRGGDVYGDGVNIASRIEALAGAGGICVSMDVERQIRNTVDTRLEKLAPTELKNISVTMDLFRIVMPWERQTAVRDRKSEVRRVISARSKWAWASALVILAVAAAAVWFLSRQTTTRSTTAAPPTTEQSIAVLPFENLSEDKANAFFASGIQDEILTRLAKINSLKVISRTSTQQYQSKPSSLNDIGRQLGVANILEGSVQKIGNAVHINVQLIKAATDAHLWAESYNRKLDDIFGVEAEVATAIAEQLNATLSGSEKKELAQKPTDNPAAYEAYLRGVTQWGQDSLESTRNAEHSFEEAVRLDPKFALAWAFLCRAHSIVYINNQDTSAARRAAAERSVTEAVRLQPQLPEVQLARATYQYIFQRDYKGARELLLELRMIWPSNAEIVQLIGWISARLGEYEKSADYLHQAISLNPRDLFLQRNTIRIHISMRDFATALRMADEALQIWPDNPRFQDQKAEIFQARGELTAAQSMVDLLTPKLSENPSQLGTRIAYQARLRRSAPPPTLQDCESAAEKPTSGRANLNTLMIWTDLLEVSGDKMRSNALLTKLRDSTGILSKEQPDNLVLIAAHAFALAGLGERDAALTVIDQGLTLTANDARWHGQAQEMKARMLARFGDRENAIPLLQHLLEISYDGYYSAPLTPALLRLDPDFDSLRGDPRFQKLCEEKSK